MREISWNVARGFLMGAADIVPGVSGGTIALVLGIYRRLIASIRAASSAIGEGARGRWSKAAAWLSTVEWQLILPLGIGIVAAVVALSSVLERQLDEAPIQMAALFLGLVAGSVVIAWNMIRSPSARLVGVVAASGLVTFWLLGLRESTTPPAVGDASTVPLVVYFLSAAVAISAMILPGISGSFLLVILGMYGPVLSAVNDRDFAALLAFAAGAIVGLALFSQLLHRALERAHDLVMALLVGLMLGSVRVLWPWPDGVDSTLLHAPDEHLPEAIGLAILGFLIVLAISAASRSQPGADTDASSAELPDGQRSS